jgi:peptidyl-prolyl cis-trans isomerase A (cyclophilin A)
MKNLIYAMSFFLSFNLQAMVNITMETTKGTIEIELDDEKAPITVENFLNYMDAGFYNGTIFHRTIKNFVVQGGGHTVDMTEKPTNAPIKNECMNGLSNLKGSLGMARNEDMDSATAQFYINTKDNVRLDQRYAVFGRVTAGYEVVEAIENSATQTIGEYEDVPIEPILIISVSRSQKPE